MRCPYCRHEDTRVVDSRDSEGGAAVRRRRLCSACDRRFTTFERATDIPMILVKRDESREPFDRAKVINGIAKACKNRPVSDDDMLRITDEVEETLRAIGSEVDSQRVGMEVLARLRELDEVAYLRFASVYKGFEDVEAFQREINELEKSSPPKRRPGVSVATNRT